MTTCSYRAFVRKEAIGLINCTILENRQNNNFISKKESEIWDY